MVQEGGGAVACPGELICDVASQQCIEACPAGLSVCPDRFVGRICLDLQANQYACGACGRACSYRQSCVAGRCLCPDGLVDCSGTCSSPPTDTANCGSCGNACGPSQTCSEGQCVQACRGIGLCDNGLEVIDLSDYGCSAPSINANGVVLFVNLDGSVSVLKDGGLAQIEVPVDQGEPAVSAHASINANGQIALAAYYSKWDVGADFQSWSVVYRIDDGGPVTIATFAGEANYPSPPVGACSIDGAGNVAFVNQGLHGWTVFTGNEAGLVPIAQSDDVFSTLYDLQRNELGTLALLAYRSDTGTTDVLVTAHGGPASTVFVGARRIALGSNDEMLIWSQSTPDVYLLTGDLGGNSEIAVFSGAANGVAAAIDDIGQVAVVREEPGVLLPDGTRTQSQELGVLLPDGTWRHFVRTGEHMLGSIISGLALAPSGFNGQGQLAFCVLLADQRGAIVRTHLASP